MRVPRFVLIAAALGFLAGATGCAATDDRQRGREMRNEDVPKAQQRVAFLEERAIDARATANKQLKLKKRREYFDKSISYLREARLLYEDELIHDPGTSEKQRNLNAEIERLSNEIERIHRDRPAG